MCICVPLLDADRLISNSSYMEKSFANSEREWAQRGTHTKRPLLDTSAVEPDLPTPAHSVARQKLSSALKDATGESSESRPDKVKNGAQGKTDGANESREVASGRKEESDAGVEIPVKPFRPTDPGRESRSTRRTTRVSEKSTARDDGASGFERQPSPENDAARKKWTKPLVYPRAEKKKAEVSVEDRDRLRADEFLNDNLIGFYMRFLQDHLERTNKQAAQRVYFFNSYFFDTLTKTPKGERGINYSGVEKWTRSVDLFSYDYIVVPINQNAHWYVAIICNLPSLELGSADPVEPSSAAVSDKETSNQPESEVQEILESPELEASLTSAAPAEVDAEKEPKREAESPASQAARQSLATMSLGEAGQAQVQGEKPMEPAQTDEWPDEDENPPITPTKFPKVRQRPPETQEQSANAPQQGRKTKKKGKAGPKLSPGQTTVITFDSLDLARSPTIRMLREYICKEAASKRGVEVDPTAIKGMRARQIPLQPNYSDCGLYLLAYVEKFVQDPDQFITKLLRREMDEKDDWPPLGSGLLRHRLRNFLDDLYEEQAKLKKDKSERKPIMADQQPVSFLLGPAQPSKDDGGGKEAVGGRSESANFSKSANAVEKPAAEKNTAQRREDGEPSDGPAADQPQLVPLETVPTSKPSKEKVPSEPLPAATASAKDSALPKEQEIIEVPDSQEKGHATITATQPGPKLIRTEKSAGKDEEACSKKPERKKAAIPAGSDIVHVDESVLKDETQVEVQVRQTPPPSEPQRVPKSP